MNARSLLDAATLTTFEIRSLPLFDEGWPRGHVTAPRASAIRQLQRGRIIIMLL
jgi:hypothetical protein